MLTDVVVGGGFAGLALATELAAAGRQVTLLERRAFLGGRAFSFTDRTTGTTVDNGQHLMMGCYHATLTFLDRIGSTSKLKRIPDSRVEFVREGGATSTFRCPPLPAPLHLLGGLCRLDTIGWRDRLAAVRLAVALRNENGTQHQLEERTVREWLDLLRQPKRLQARFWDPLALATVNEAPDRASADVFAEVIKEAFLGSREDSTLILSRVGLSDLYTQDARAFVESFGGTIRLNATVGSIEFDGSTAIGVILQNGERIPVRTLTCAIPPAALLSILPSKLITEQKSFANLSLIETSPIVSINLWFDEAITEIEFGGLVDSPIEWVFNKNRITGQPGSLQQLALVISGAHEAAKLKREDLIELAWSEVKRFFPAARKTPLRHAHVVRERNATISHLRGVSRLRPPNQTPFRNFFVAGDWTATGLPATIESAVRSGYSCANLILGTEFKL
jgi:hydroxysqualene dehydroxylase